jgi:glycosyltransferase involved in cell wall biosynthesis
MRRRRVLVGAYAISPVRGSEPGMGWNIVTRLARHHDVTALCSTGVPAAQDFRAEIAHHEATHGPIPGLRFEFVTTPLLSHLVQRETPWLRRSVYYAGYRAWQRAALTHARALHARAPFDLVHQLNITTFREPGYLWSLPVPFVWGPVGGAAEFPAAFLPLMSRRERLFYIWRAVANRAQQARLRRCRAAARRAAHVWVVGDANHDLVTRTWGVPAERMLEAGAESHPRARVRRLERTRPLRLVWSGQHIGRKALPLLLHALAHLRGEVNATLTVLGAGPETDAWRRLAADLGVAAQVQWAGQLPRASAIAEMDRADVFVSTSLLEETSLVILEALALGLPVICHDACGMREAITDRCGIKLPLRTPESSIRGFAGAIRALAQGGVFLERRSAGAIARARELSWDAKAEAMAARYARIAGAADGGDRTSARRQVGGEAGPPFGIGPLPLPEEVADGV